MILQTSSVCNIVFKKTCYFPSV